MSVGHCTEEIGVKGGKCGLGHMARIDELLSHHESFPPDPGSFKCKQKLWVGNYLIHEMLSSSAVTIDFQ